MLFGVGVLSRLILLQTKEHARWLELASKQHQTSLRVQGVRGKIEDAHGRPLAVSVPVVSLAAHPQQITNKVEFVRLMGSLVGSSERELQEVLNTKKSFVWLARGLPLSVLQDSAVRNLSGLSVVREFQRYYPQGDLAGNVLGRVGSEGNGLAGVEYVFDRQLKATDLTFRAKRDARGALVGVKDRQLSIDTVFANLAFADDWQKPFPEAPFRREGADFALTLDSVLQRILEEEFKLGQEETRAKAVSGVLMDAETGEILSLVQQSALAVSEPQALSSADLKNIVIEESFEPGSTLKPIVALAALENKLLQPTDLLDCEGGSYRVGSHTISDVHPLEVATFREVLVKSSNIGMTKIGQKLGRKKLYQVLKKFGFGEKTGVELPGEASGILRDLEDWKEIDIATHSFGQGISVTALQLAQAYSILANGGYLVPPRILKGRGESAQRVVDEVSVRTLSQMLLGVTSSEEGTGKNAALSGVDVYGKTGTAQKTVPGRRGYSSDSVISSFIGYVDGNQVGLKRKLTLVVIVDEPGVTPRWGGVVAAPIFRRAMERTLSYLLTLEGGGVQTALNVVNTHSGIEEQSVVEKYGVVEKHSG